MSVELTPFHRGHMIGICYTKAWGDSFLFFETNTDYLDVFPFIFLYLFKYVSEIYDSEI